MSVLLKDGTEITESFGDKIEDLKAVIKNYSIDIAYLDDDYFLKTYLRQCVPARDLQFKRDTEYVLDYLKKTDEEVQKLYSRIKGNNHHKTRDIESEVLQLTKAREIFRKYSNSNNEEAQNAIRLLTGAIGELNNIKVELKSYVFRHKDLPQEHFSPLTINSHFKSYSNNLLENRIDYFKPKPQTINECINNNYYLLERQFNDVLDMKSVLDLFDYLKDYYKKP